MYAAVPDTFKLSKFTPHVTDTGTHIVGVETTSGVNADHLYGIADLSNYILGTAISGVEWTVPVFENGHIIGNSNIGDSITTGHSYVYDSIKIFGWTELGVVPPAVLTDSPLVMGLNTHKVRAVHPPVGDSSINYSWPGNVVGVNRNYVVSKKDSGIVYVTPYALSTFTVAPTGAAGGDLVGSYPNPTLHTSGMVAGTYGSASVMPVYTVDAKGRITTFSTVNIVPTNAAGGVLAGAYPNPNLAATTVTAGSYGGGGQVGTFTVNAAGQLTAAANVAIKPDTINGVGVSPGGNITVAAVPTAAYMSQNDSVTSNPSTYAINSTYGNTESPVNVYFVGQTNNITMSAPTGSYMVNQFVEVIFPSGTYTISWNSAFVPGTTTNGGVLPTVAVSAHEQRCTFQVTRALTFAFYGYSIN